MTTTIEPFITNEKDAPGVHLDGNITFQSGEKIEHSYVFGRIEDKKLKRSTKDCYAIGIITDCGCENDPLNVQIFGANSGTMKVRVSQSVSMGDLIASDDNGFACVVTNQVSDSTVILGLALGEASPGELVEFTPYTVLRKSSLNI